MAVNALEQGVRAVQAGNTSEGARLLRAAIQGDLPPNLRAIAYLWLAETTPDPAQKRQCYSAALAADPSNLDARARLNAMIPAPPEAAPPPANLPNAPASPPATLPESAPPPPNLPEAAPPHPARPPLSVSSALDITAAVDGANGRGSAFFIHPQGILATTRFVVGGMTQVTVILRGEQLRGTVVRSFLDLDAALIRVDAGLQSMWAVSPAPVPENAPLTLVFPDGTLIGGAQRPTKRAMPAHWLPTSFQHLPDAGGAPIFDARSYLVGMITRNTARNAEHAFGVQISALLNAVNVYLREASERRVYCPACGSLSRLLGAGFFDCEVCGTAGSNSGRRRPTPQAEPYYGLQAPPCPRCGAVVGSLRGRCVRCGQ